MDDRPAIRGTTDWQQIEFVTDVPNEPCIIFTGPDLYGPGEMWGDDFQIELAAADIPPTDDRNWRLTSKSPDIYSETNDYLNLRDGNPAIRVAYTSPDPLPRGSWAWWGQKLRGPEVERYAGHTVRMSGEIKLDTVSGYLEPAIHPWKWASGVSKQVGRDSMSRNRSLKGTLDWTPFSVTCEVPKDAQHIDTSFILWGSGTVWIDMSKFKFEVVD